MMRMRSVLFSSGSRERLRYNSPPTKSLNLTNQIIAGMAELGEQRVSRIMIRALQTGSPCRAGSGRRTATMFQMGLPPHVAALCATQIHKPGWRNW